MAHKGQPRLHPKGDVTATSMPQGGEFLEIPQQDLIEYSSRGNHKITEHAAHQTTRIAAVDSVKEAPLYRDAWHKMETVLEVHRACILCIQWRFSACACAFYKPNKVRQGLLKTARYCMHVFV